MSSVQVKYLSDNAVEYLKANLDFVNQKMIDNPTDSSWLKKSVGGELFVPKKFTFEEFSLKVPEGPEDRSADFDNSIALYEHFKHLPQYVLSDERFWLWVNFEIGYEVALRYMPVKDSKAVVKDHWLFSQGRRRGLFFGVLSRCYYRVALSVDESAADPYELTRFVIENPLRFRELTWRAMSSERHIVMGTLRAEKKLLDEFDFEENGKVFAELAKTVSKAGSVKILDCMSEGDIEELVYRSYKSLLQERGVVLKRRDGEDMSPMSDDATNGEELLNGAGSASDAGKEIPKPVDNDKRASVLSALRNSFRKRSGR